MELNSLIVELMDVTDDLIIQFSNSIVSSFSDDVIGEYDSISSLLERDWSMLEEPLMRAQKEWSDNYV